MNEKRKVLSAVTGAFLRNFDALAYALPVPMTFVPAFLVAGGAGRPAFVFGCLDDVLLRKLDGIIMSRGKKAPGD